MRWTIATGFIAITALAAAVAVPAAATGAAAPPEHAASSGRVPVVPDWTSAGQNEHNTRDAATERFLGPGNVGQLAPRWVVTTGVDVVATPTVADGVVYVPDVSGNLWAIRASDGTVLWTTTISSYTGVSGSFSRTSPAVFGDELVFGTGPLDLAAPDDAYIVAVDARTGALRWRTLADSAPGARITGSPVVSQGVVYAGVSSSEEDVPAAPTFRGSVVALSARTGKMLWQTYTAPSGYTGNAVWGSTPVVDHRTGLLYVGTGNNYTVPAGVCETPAQTGCAQPAADDYEDSVLALRLRTGSIAWARKTLTSDVTTSFSGGGSDFDFGSGPNLYTTDISGRPTDLLGIGQKSGTYWALNPWTGDVVWRTQVGPGGDAGGIEWGAATDGHRIYVAIADSNLLTYTIVTSPGHTVTINGGSWSALDAATGKILWQTADPEHAPDFGFVSTAKGVVYAGSAASAGRTMYALDAANGAVLWQFASGGSVVSGAAIVGGSVYWGSGDYMPEGVVANDKLYAFSIPRP